VPDRRARPLHGRGDRLGGVNVFEANPTIIKELKDEGAGVRHDSYDHNYPHCWRTDEPLIYRAISRGTCGHRLQATAWSS
jgi:isoleucyl-tRNA synthetase